VIECTGEAAPPSRGLLVVESIAIGNQAQKIAGSDVFELPPTSEAVFKIRLNGTEAGIAPVDIASSIAALSIPYYRLMFAFENAEKTAERRILQSDRVPITAHFLGAGK
jgi:hypothetical protein